MSDLEYVVKNALMMCEQGAAPDFFKPTYNTTTKFEGVIAATNMDGIPIDNIPSFFMCKITEKICRPETSPNTWKDTCPAKIKGSEILLQKSTCPCKIGGTVGFLTSGQIPLPQEMKEEVESMQKEAKEQLNDAGYGDSVGESGFCEGFVPVWGSGRDAVNDFQQGRWGWGIFNSAMVVVDVCTLGVGSVVKGGIKGVVKSGVKALSKGAFKNLGKQAFKKLSKENLENALKALAKKKLLNPATYCFAAGTPIHTINDLKNIENIQIGGLVKSFDLINNKLTYNKVVTLLENEVEEIIEIITEKDVIKTTKNHPFYINGEFKDAEQITTKDYFETFDNKKVKIISIRCIQEKIKVYNFEVEESHCYFVGKEGFLVSNICEDGLKMLAGQVPDIFKKMFSCKEFAAAFKKILQENGIEGAEVILKSDTGRIWSESLGKVISTNGDHVGIKVGDLIFDNLNPKGIPYKKWLDDLGADFPGMRPPKIDPF